MICEKYGSAKITFKCCFARQKKAGQPGRNDDQAKDPGCLYCDQGRAALKAFGLKPFISKDMIGFKVCTHPDCKRKGKPQALKKFYKRTNGVKGRARFCIECEKKYMKTWANNKKLL